MMEMMTRVTQLAADPKGATQEALQQLAAHFTTSVAEDNPDGWMSWMNAQPQPQHPSTPETKVWAGNSPDFGRAKRPPPPALTPAAAQEIERHRAAVLAEAQEIERRRAAAAPWMHSLAAWEQSRPVSAQSLACSRRRERCARSVDLLAGGSAKRAELG